MTLPELRKAAKQDGFKLRARTVDFEDLARCSRVFLTLCTPGGDTLGVGLGPASADDRRAMDWIRAHPAPEGCRWES